MARSASKPRAKPSELDDPSDCLCSELRRTARVITQTYDDALQPFGLTVSQFCLLALLADKEVLTVQGLADKLGMDRSTLSRALLPLARDKLVRQSASEDRRERRYALTAAGAARVKSARPAWLKAQRHVTGAFGSERSATLIAELKTVRGVTGSA